MSKEIDYGNLVYNFKGPTTSINFTIFGGPMYTTTSRGRAKRFLKRFK